MHKHYPYLQDSFIYQTDIEREKRNILNEIDSFVNQRQYVKITLLNWDEEPIKAIEGEISSGSISKNGDSPIRRTAQLTCAVDARSYSVDDGKADFAINKKVFIEIGVKNETPHYPEFPIFWFPEGVFFIGSFSINAGSNSSTTITLSLKDKMAMLNGDIGGILPTTVIFDTMDTQLPNGEYVQKKVLIYNIIQELVNHYGGEDLSRIVIEGVPLRIRRIMQWYGDTPIWQISTGENFDVTDSDWPISEEDIASSLELYTYTTIDPQDNSPQFDKGDDIGYIMDDFVITDELTGAPGESVTSILDKIKNIIGNYEYFYDVFGTFHFREIKNYYVTTQARTLLDEMSENDYLVETNNSRSIYTFDDEKLLTSITVNPQYENIKNDYIVEGQTTIGDSEIVTPIRYHLVIDKKPKFIGIDKRETIRKKIDNNIKIDKLTEDLKQLMIQKSNSNTILEQLLYTIRNAKAYIKDKEDQIDIKDKELLKQLQEIFSTAYTYEELADDNVLLSEKWLIFYIETYNKNNIDNIVDIYNNTKSYDKLSDLLKVYKIILEQVSNTLFLTDVTLQSIQDSTTEIFAPSILDMEIAISHENNQLQLNDLSVTVIYDMLEKFISQCIFPGQNQYANIINTLDQKIKEQTKDIQSLEDFVQTIENSGDETDTIIQKIKKYDEDNFSDNDKRYREAKDAIKRGNIELKSLQAEHDYYSTLNDQLTQTNLHIKNNMLEILQIIRTLQKQRNAKLEALDGNSNNTLIGIENNHECLIQYDNDSIIWFSHNLDKITTEECTKISGDEYSFISNDMEITKKLFKEHEYNFYEGSWFAQFYKELINNSDIINLDNQIQDLQNEIADLKSQNGNFDYDYDNPHYATSYYETYPIAEEEEMILYKHPRNGLVCAAFVKIVETLPDIGNFNLIYKQESDYYYWTGTLYETINPIEIYDMNDEDNKNQYYAYDWRTKLYLDGLRGVANGTDKGYYYAELSAFWPQIYNLQTQKFFSEEKDSVKYNKELAIAGVYYLDFLDEIDSSFGEWSVNNIGRRSDVIVKEEINCLFQPEIPNVILLPQNDIDLSRLGNNPIDKIYRYGNSLEGEWTLEQLRQEAINNFYPYTQVSSEIYNNLLTGGYRNGAFDQIKYELYLHTRYQKSISLTSIPVFYLEPNSRITLNDTTTNTYGDFVIQSINLTLGPGANMSITCNETAERF